MVLEYIKSKQVHSKFCMIIYMTLPVPIPDEERKLTEIFYFHTSLWCLKSVKAKISVNFYFNVTF